MKNEITYLLHAGWLVGSPAYEMNPNPYGRNLALAVWGEDTTRDYDIAIRT